MKLKSILTAIAATSIYLIHPADAAQTAASQPIPLDKVIAIVNNSVITENQLRQQLLAAQQQMRMNQTPIPNAARLREQVLDHIIENELELQIAKQMGIIVDDTEVDKAIADIAARNRITSEHLRAELQKQGIDYKHYRKEIRDQMTISQVQQKALVGKINVSETEINELAAQLAKRPTPINPATEYQVQDILVALSATPTTEEVQEKKQKAETLLAKLRKGENFQRLAAEESNGQQALQGGDLGWRKLNELPELFAQKVKTMKPGDIAGPIRASNGYHLIRLAGIGNQGHEVPQSSITETQVQQIFIKNDALSNATANKLRLASIRNDIVHGHSFAKLAAENSQDPNSLQNGGLMGWIKPGTIDPNFEEIMNQLKPGEISQPFATQYGWHIIQVLARRQVDNRKDFYRDQARQIIFKRKAEEAIQTWLQELRGQAYIKINTGKE